jgi:hypothetical protein
MASQRPKLGLYCSVVEGGRRYPEVASAPSGPAYSAATAAVVELTDRLRELRQECRRTRRRPFYLLADDRLEVQRGQE